MHRALATFLILIAVTAAAAAGAAGWVLYTPAGLAWALGQVERMAGGAIVLQYDSGTLGGGALFTQIRYETPPLTVDVQRAQIRLSPLSLLRLAPHVTELDAAHVHITLRPDGEPSGPAEVPALPVSLRVDKASIGKLVVERNGEKTEFQALSFGYDADASAHKLRSARGNLNGFDIDASGTVGSRAPFTIDAKALVIREGEAPRLSASISATGNLQQLAVNVTAESAGARLHVIGEIAPAAERPVTRLDANVANLNLRALEDALPQTALSGELVLAPADGQLAGRIELTNSMSGPYEKGLLPISRLHGAIRTDLAQVDLSDLAIELGTAGELSGSARLQRERLTLTLTTRDLDLRGVHGNLRSTRLKGRAEAALTPDRQSITADLAQDDMRLQLRAERAGEVVELREAVARARGGEARALGKLTLNERQPFSAQVRFKGFDPAAWGDFPRGSISGRLAAQGMVQGPAAKVEFALGASRLHDAPLAGAGRFALAGQRLSAAGFELRLGANHLTVNGAFGGPNDTLRVRVDAPRLATLDPRLTGRVKAEARLGGTLKSPLVRFDASAEALKVAEKVSIDRATATGAYAANPSAPLRLTAEAAGLTANDRRLARITLEIEGSQAAHTAAIRASGKDFEIVARARGGWKPNEWSGTLTEFTNRGALEVALESPVALSMAPHRFSLGRFGVRVMDGRLEVEESRYAEGKIFTKGRFSRLPVAALATATGLSPLGGTLRASGSWALVQDRALTGSFSVRRESGDIALDPAGTFPMQLQNLAIDGRLGAERFDFHASLQSAIATGQAEGTIGMVATDQGPRITPESSLRFSARLAIAQLSPFARLADASVLVNGALNAVLTGRGAIGQPAVTGDITGERLAVALPPQGIDLKDGSLRAVLTERALRVDSLSMRGGEGTFKARGNLVFKEGEHASIDWQADRLLLLGRPDRRLIVSGKGRAGLADKKLSLSGGLRAVEGHFEIAADDLPAPGSDVVVAGRKPPAKEDSRLSRTVLELVLDFGSNLRIRGRGLDTRLAGDITVGTGGNGNLRAKGTVRTVRGTYTAFGQRLEIERGELLFSGPVDNPGLDIRAMRKRQAVEAGVAVTGTLRSPLARIVSEPPVPESEAISWLVLGHGTADASRGDLAMLPLAAASLLGNDDSPTIAQRFGLDTLGLRGAGTESQFVTAGKRIADRLYVGFEQGLGAAESILKLEFDLTRRVLVRAQTGSTNAVGVFYRYSFD